jgi:peptide deformylase
MSILKVARMGHPVLRARARPLEAGELGRPRIQQLIDDMIETMREYNGIGLAAPQVHESVRLFVAGFGADDDRLPLMAVINPEITPVGRNTAEDWEGCLSIPEIRGRVVRPDEVRLRALDRQGRPIDLTATGFAARVLQHETDHLDGILFFDRMKSFETLTFMEEFERYWGED